MSSKDEIQLRVSNAYIKYCELEDKSNKKNINEKLDATDLKILTRIFKFNISKSRSQDIISQVEKCFKKWYLVNASQKEITDDCIKLSNMRMTAKNAKKIWKSYRKYYYAEEVLIKQPFKLFLKEELNISTDIKKGGWCHYWNLVRLFKAIEDLVKNNKFSSSPHKISECQFDLFKKSGLMFQKSAYSLMKCAIYHPTKCIEIMRNCLDNWEKFSMNGGREILEEYLDSELIDIKKRQDSHERLVKFGKSYLQTEKKCYPIIPRREPFRLANGNKMIEIDLNGWALNGDVYGIDAKTSVNDIRNFLNKDKYKIYSNFCNKFYILTNNIEVEEFMKNEKNQKKYEDCDKLGILFCDSEGNITEKKKPVNCKTPQSMHIYIEKHFKNNICSRLQAVTLCEQDTWQTALEKFKNAIEQS